MQHITTQRGMSLVEMIVAISVLMFTVLGPITLATRGLHAASDAQNEIAAIYLASEALEVVHNYRDNNSATDYTIPTLHDKWLNGISAACAGTNGCILDPADRTAPLVNGVWGSNTFVVCDTTNCVGGSDREDHVYYNPSTGFYRQSKTALGSPWRKTGLQRVVNLTLTGAGHARVDVTVRYPASGGMRSVKLTDDITNWFFTF